MVVPSTISWEVIVVDNGSTDATSAVIRDAQARARLPLKYVCEPRPGKSASLNTALSEAKGDVVAFTDDDCVVAPDWLASMIEEFAGDPSIAGIGGRVELYDARDQPYTIRTHRCREQFSPAKLVSLIVGCNMAFTRTALERVGEFDPTLGPGSDCRAAEDFDLLYRVYKAGLRIVYVPEVLVHHNHGRRTASDVRRLYTGYGISLGAFYGKYILRGDTEVIGMACRHAVSIAVGIGRSALVRNRLRRPNRIRVRDLVTGATLQVSYLLK
jgi:GT2 family glycosyltransferase